MKKRILSILTLLCVVTALLPANITVFAATGTNNDFAGGSGTEQDPYLIETAEQLSNVANYYQKYFKITKDIYLNDVTDWENWDKNPPKNTWTPIDLQDSNLDGNNKTIYGLYTAKGNDWQGLFHTICGSVKDLTISQSLIQGTNYCGSFAGSLSRGSIVNCIFNGKVLVNGNYNGGLLGNLCNENTVISHCTNNGNVENTLESNNSNDALRLGGIVGQAHDYCKILNSTNTGTISSYSSQCGGIVGHAYNNKSTDYIIIDSCINKGNIITKDTEYDVTNIGGIAGGAFTHALIDRCVNYGTINAIATDYTSALGGIVGFCNESSVKNSTNLGIIYCKNYERIGGIVGNGYGENEGIYNCANVGNINYDGDNYNRIGGIVGWTGEDYSIINVFNAGSLPEKDAVGAIIGYMDSTITNIDSWYCRNDINSIIASKYNNSSSVDTQKFALDYFKKSEFVELFNKYITDNQTKTTGYYKWKKGNSDTNDFPIISDEKLPIIRKASEYKINSIIASDYSGNSLEYIPTAAFLATISVTKILEGGDTLIVIAQYATDNRMIGLTYAMVEDQNIGSTVKITVPINNSDGNIKEIKAFNLSSFSELAPLSKTVSIYSK